MFNKFLIAIFFLLSFSLTAMEQPKKGLDEKAINAKNLLGDTPLHIAVLSLEELRTRYPAFYVDLPQAMLASKTYDMEKAKTAATLISLGAQVDIKNGELTPIGIATKNKTSFPEIYEVLKAGEIVQSWEKNAPKPQNGLSYTWDELQAASQTVTLVSLDTYLKSLVVLRKYLTKPSRKTEQKQ
jgi:hypothetical protein